MWLAACCCVQRIRAGEREENLDYDSRICFLKSCLFHNGHNLLRGHDGVLRKCSVCCTVRAMAGGDWFLGAFGKLWIFMGSTTTVSHSWTIYEVGGRNFTINCIHT